MRPVGTRPRGQCRVCHRMYVLIDPGVVRLHFNCPGGHQDPLTDEEIAGLPSLPDLDYVSLESHVAR